MIQPHELADMRRTADKAPFDTQQKFHALLDAYEGKKNADALEEEIDDLKKNAADAVRALREVYPSTFDAARELEKRKEFGEPLSEDAWAERLADSKTPEERATTMDEELERARAAEVKLRARVDALEEAIESAIDELE